MVHVCHFSYSELIKIMEMLHINPISWFCGAQKDHGEEIKDCSMFYYNYLVWNNFHHLVIHYDLEHI